MLTGYQKNKKIKKRRARKEKKKKENNTETRQRSIFYSVAHTSNLQTLYSDQMSFFNWVCVAHCSYIC